MRLVQPTFLPVIYSDYYLADWLHMAVGQPIISNSLICSSFGPEQNGPSPKLSIFLRDTMGWRIQCKPIRGTYNSFLWLLTHLKIHIWRCVPSLDECHGFDRKCAAATSMDPSVPVSLVNSSTRLCTILITWQHVSCEAFRFSTPLGLI